MAILIQNRHAMSACLAMLSNAYENQTFPLSLCVGTRVPEVAFTSRREPSAGLLFGNSMCIVHWACMCARLCFIQYIQPPVNSIGGVSI